MHMHTVTIGGKEYILRCDMNVVEQVEEKLGSIEEAKRKSGSANVLKFCRSEHDGIGSYTGNVGSGCVLCRKL